jgi:histidinol dehydrogenase
MSAKLSIKTAEWAPGKSSSTVDAFLNRPAFEPQAEDAARAVLQAVQKDGDAAVIRFAKNFDGTVLKPSTLRVSEQEIADAGKQVDPAFKKAARDTLKRIRAFAAQGMRKNWRMKTEGGGVLGEIYTPLDRIGAYIPSGTAPLVSTALMTIAFAAKAGVKEIVACSPAGSGGDIDPYTLYAMNLAGATEIYRIGGIQAIGAMAYGTRTVTAVQKIVGPGGPYVTAAKRQVYGVVDLDLVAGPSEVAILADSKASARYVAADLLAQAEHGTGSEKALLVTPSARLIQAVQKELKVQLAALSRADRIAPVLRKGTLMVKVASLKDGMELCNQFAPEHFEILTEKPDRWVSSIRAAGAVFLGPWTPEVAGDFSSGPSHVLPTGGAARMFSGLTVEDFRKKTSILRLTKKDLQQQLPTIQAFSRVEGLDAHGRSAEMRFE